MRTDVVWPVVWGACFVGGVIFGSTSNTPSVGLTRPMLRGSGRITKDTTRQHNTKATPSKRDVAAKHAGNKAVSTNKGDAKKTTVETKKEGATEDEEGEAKTPSKIDPTGLQPINVNANNDNDKDGAAAAAPSPGRRALAYGSQQHPGLKSVSALIKREKIRELNGGLWDPNDEEDASIAEEFATSEGTYVAVTEEPYDLTLYPGDYSYSFDYDYDMSFDFSYSYYY